MRTREKLVKTWGMKMLAKRPKVAASIFIPHVFTSFSLVRIGSALQGVPRAMTRPPLDPPRDPKGPPGRRFSGGDDFCFERHLRGQNARFNNDT